jgi:hypothetical protein
MVRIGTIRLAFRAKAFWSNLSRINNIHTEKINSADLSKYVLRRVNMDNLKTGNILCSFNGSPLPQFEPESSNNAGADQILFSAGEEEISTNASACSSYMLHCEKTGALAAIHVSSGHLHEIDFHKNMMLYAYVNLSKMAPKDVISAYISGMHVSTSPQFDDIRDGLIEQKMKNLIYIVNELIGLGVQIRLIDIGYDYFKQTFSPQTREYNLTFASER